MNIFISIVSGERGEPSKSNCHSVPAELQMQQITWTSVNDLQYSVLDAVFSTAALQISSGIADQLKTSRPTFDSLKSEYSSSSLVPASLSPHKPQTSFFFNSFLVTM